MRIRNFIILVFLLFIAIFLSGWFWCPNVHAYDSIVCVGPVGTGDSTGGDWDNIKGFNQLWTLSVGDNRWDGVRGVGYYFQDGTYPPKGLILNTAESDTTRLFFIKAIESNHGVATGWVSTMGDGIALFPDDSDKRYGVFITTSFIHFNGGPDSTGTQSRGFCWALSDPPDTTTATEQEIFMFDGAFSNIDLWNIELDGVSHDIISSNYTKNYRDAIRCGNGVKTNIHLKNVYSHDWVRCHLKYLDVRESIIEDCVFTNLYGDDLYTPHGEPLSAFKGIWNLIIRNNLFRNFEGTGCLVFHDNVLVNGPSDRTSYVRIYGNVFHQADSDKYSGTNGVVATLGAMTSFDSLMIWNCTFIGADTEGGMKTYLPAGSIGGFYYNNLAYLNLHPDGIDTDFDQGYNAGDDASWTSGTGEILLTSDPFVDYLNYDYHIANGISELIDNGLDISDSAFVATTLDPDAVDREGSWTPGAFEYAEATPPAGRSHLDKTFIIMDSYAGASPDSIPKTAIADSILSGDTAVLGEDIKTTATIDFPEGDVLLQSKIGSIFKISVEQDLSSFTYVPGEVQYTDSLSSGANNRDSALRHGVGYADNAWMNFGYSTTPRDGNMQFQMNIAQGATIDEAKLLVYNERAATETVDLKIGAHDQDNAAVYADSTEYNAGIAAFTTAVVDWDEDVANDQFVVSPDIKTVVKEIVDRGSWVANNWISLFIINEPTNTTEKYIESYQYNNGSLYPKLYITWTEGSGNSYAGKTVAEPRQVFLNGVLGVKQVTTDSLYDESPNWVYEDGKVKVFPADTTGVHITGFAPAITATDSMLVRNIAVENATTGFTFTGALNKLHNVFLDSMIVGFSLPSGSLEIANDFFTANVDTAGSVAEADSLTALKLYSVNNNYTEAGVEGALSDIATAVVTSGADLDADYTPNSGSTTIDAGTNTTDGLEVNIRDLGPGEFQRVLTLTSFIGGGAYNIGIAYPITWTSIGVDSIKIEYTSDELGYNNVIISLDATLGTYSWTIPDAPSTTCKVRITDVDDGSVSDESASVFIIATLTYGPPWYGDVTSGDDSNGGGAADCPLKTIAAVMDTLADSGSPGDIVYLKAGEEWRETMTIPVSGTDGFPYTITRYGEGADPIINGADEMTGPWHAYGTNKFVKTGISTQPKILMHADSLGTLMGSSVLCVKHGDWFWTTSGSDSLVVYLAADAHGDTTSSIEAGQRDYGIYVNRKDYLTFDNITVKYVNLYGNYLLGDCDYITINNSTYTYCGSYGIYTNDVGESPTNNTISNNIISYNNSSGFFNDGLNTATVTNNTINNNNSYGIYLSNSSNSNTISNNSIYSNTSHGIYVYTSCRENIIENNEIYSNTGNGIYILTCNSNTIRYNNIYSQTGSTQQINLSAADSTNVYYNIIRDGTQGCYLSNSDYCNIYNNTLLNHLRSITIYNTCIGTVIRNNLSISPTYHVYLYGTPASTVYTGTNNCYWPIHTNSFWGEVIGYCHTLATWQAATGQESNSIDLWPAVTDTTANNFVLLTTSPCIGRGYNWGATLDYAGDTVPMPAGELPDIGAYEEQTVIIEKSGRILTSGKPGKLLNAGSPRKILNAGKP